MAMAAQPDLLASEAEQIAHEQDLVKACEFLTGACDPLVSARGFHEMVRRSWRAKNISAMILFGQAGMQFSLQASTRHSQNDRNVATQLRSQAKAMAYDVSANLWPGWDDEGITLGPMECSIGMQLAKTNLRLAKELERSGEPLGHAWWLLGAHELAARNFHAAEAAFAEAVKHYEGDYVLMCRGYSFLSAQLAEDVAKRTSAPTEFEKILKALRESDRSDAKFFAAQLETATKVFLRDAAK
jgi:hypothetical protein